MTRSMDTAPRDGTWVLAEPDYMTVAPENADWLAPLVIVRWEPRTERWFERWAGVNYTSDQLRGWRPLPSGDGWTRIEDGEPDWSGPPVFAVIRFGPNGKRKVVVGMWGDLQAWTLTAWQFTHWQYAHLPALPQEDE